MAPNPERSTFDATRKPSPDPVSNELSRSVSLGPKPSLSNDTSSTSSPTCNISAPTHFPSYPDRTRPWYHSILFWRRNLSIRDQQHNPEIEVKAREAVVKTLSRSDVRPEVITIITNAFLSGDHQPMNSLKGKLAQGVLNALQELLLHDDFNGNNGILIDTIQREARWLVRRRLQQLCCTAFLLPLQVSPRDVILLEPRDLTPGANADVYCGFHNEERVAIKHLRIFISATSSDVENWKRGFYREAILWFNLNHQNVLKFMGISDEDHSGLPGLCMILQWAQNRDLRRYLSQLVQDGLRGRLYLDKVDQWICGIASGLEYLHENGVVHGDLHPSNILVDANGTVLLADFGLSVIGDVGSSYTAPDGKRTVYTAPELLEYRIGFPRPTFKSDIYSFAFVCVELFLNGPPFGDLNEYQIMCKVIRGKRPERPQVSGHKLRDSTWSLIRSCWSQEPHSRPTASEIVVTVEGHNA